ncbi:MAG TPA: peptide deformylase [Candidatus Omnitrophota bacterium]|nr:peptide deformylase [Candidatus Omnitrophota bacterium]HPS37617.1 peptide deformylase [Candidatus Omnitrophota bacterium]
MKSSSLRIFPDPVLRKKTLPVVQFDRALLKLVARMVRTMKSQSHGIGIAAPQIGVSKAVAVVDVSARDPRAHRLILVNPVILEKRDAEARKEGCMSLPDYTAYLKRHRWVRFRFQDERGAIHEKISAGIEAICVEHEVDHLSGILFIDHVTCLKTDLFPRSLSSKK